VRLWRDDDGIQIVAMANGFDHAFATCWPRGSRWLLDRFEEAWVASRTSGAELGARLCGAFERARQEFGAQAGAGALAAEPIDELDDGPHATLLVMATDGSVAHLVWIGGDTAFLVRGLSALAVTTPHTGHQQIVDRGLGPFDPATVPNFLVRSIGADCDQPPSTVRVALTAGDTLIVASWGGELGLDLTTAEMVGAHGAPAELAASIVGRAPDQRAFTAVATVRVDSTDIGAAIDRLIDRYQPDAHHGAWLGEWARQHRLLPVYFDIGGVIALGRDGSLWGVAWDESPAPVRERGEPMLRIAALAVAARRYPELRALAPVRPTGTRSCPQCTAPGEQVGRGCCWCAYLGWPLPWQGPIATPDRNPSG
jgi:hypothetical protein